MMALILKPRRMAFDRRPRSRVLGEGAPFVGHPLDEGPYLPTHHFVDPDARYVRIAFCQLHSVVEVLGGDD